MRIRRFFQTVYSDDAARSLAERRRRVPDLLRYLRNEALRPVDACLVARHKDVNRPVVFIVGAPRSGTTLLYQLVSLCLDVGYLSNAVAPFWNAPLAGALWVRTRYGRTRPGHELRSRLGRAPDPFGPHEFSWFWQYWGDFAEHDDLRGAELDRVDWRAIARCLAALAGFYDRPLVLKSINFTNYQTRTLAEHLPGARFLWISRDPLYCAQSILEARRSRYGNTTRWWSVRPRDFRDRLEDTPERQVVHQIADVEQALERARRTLPRERFHHLHYEDVVDAPAPTLAAIAEFLALAPPNPASLETIDLKTRNEIVSDIGSLAALEGAIAEMRAVTGAEP